MKCHKLTDESSDWDTYWFEKNLQGDVVAVYDDAGVKLITYTYDAWGRFTESYTHSAVEYSPATHSPFRYRSYYYDEDLGMYYLGSRYYDSTTGRFISLDREDVIAASPMGLTDKNLYAYCDNNPITRVDKDGEFWHVLVGAAVGAAVGFISNIIEQTSDGGKIDWAIAGVATISGAASGALATVGASPLVGVAIQMAGNAIISGGESLATQTISNGFENVDYGKVAQDAVMGSITNAGNGLSKGAAKHLTTQAKRARKQIKIKGFKKAIKYYYSQTKTIFYKPLFSDASGEVAKTAIICNRNTPTTYVHDRMLVWREANS